MLSRGEENSSNAGCRPRFARLPSRLWPCWPCSQATDEGVTGLSGAVREPRRGPRARPRTCPQPRSLSGRSCLLGAGWAEFATECVSNERPGWIVVVRVPDRCPAHVARAQARDHAEIAIRCSHQHHLPSWSRGRQNDSLPASNHRDPLYRHRLARRLGRRRFRNAGEHPFAA